MVAEAQFKLLVSYLPFQKRGMINDKDEFDPLHSFQVRTGVKVSEIFKYR